MDLAEIQKQIKVKYGTIDNASGTLFLLLVLLEECGELAAAVRHNEATAKDEVVDVIFCALSIANLLAADVDNLLQKKYLLKRVDEVTKNWTDITR
ncbi:MAG: MazG nucleotide pyrophosphohydrolase domain-containing protein [Halobacteriota archaeon]